MNALASLLHPITPHAFREHYYGRQPLVMRGNGGKFGELFTWEDLNRLLNASPLPHPEVQLYEPDGRKQPATAAAILEQCRAGASMIFNHIDQFEPKIGALARALEAEMGEPVNVNMYLSPAGRGAASRHYDRHDVFVLQVEGRKVWSVYERTVEKPIYDMPAQSAESPGAPMLTCELAPGDVLYMPRGHWHEALAQDGLSLHLTFGINARTGIDFLKWLAGELRGDVRFREELPLTFAGEGSGRREEHVAKLKEMLVARLEDRETFSAFEKHCVISGRDAHRFKFPGQLLDSADATHFSRPAHQRCVLEDVDDLVELSVWGHIFQFPKRARPLLELILSHTEFSLEEAMQFDCAREVVDPLVREGILDVTRRTASAHSPATPDRR